MCKHLLCHTPSSCLCNYLSCTAFHRSPHRHPRLIDASPPLKPRPLSLHGFRRRCYYFPWPFSPPTLAGRKKAVAARTATPSAAAHSGCGRTTVPRDHRIRPPTRASAVCAGRRGERSRLASPPPLSIRKNCNEPARELAFCAAADAAADAGEVEWVLRVVPAGIRGALTKRGGRVAATVAVAAGAVAPSVAADPSTKAPKKEVPHPDNAIPRRVAPTLPPKRGQKKQKRDRDPVTAACDSHRHLRPRGWIVGGWRRGIVASMSQKPYWRLPSRAGGLKVRGGG